MRRKRNTEPRAVATGSRLVETKLALNTTASATISFESIVARPGRYYHPSAAAALGTPVCSRFRICVPLESSGPLVVISLRKSVSGRAVPGIDLEARSDLLCRHLKPLFLL